MRLAEHRYHSIASARGQLLTIDDVEQVRMGEIVTIVHPDGSLSEGEVLSISGSRTTIQAFSECRGIQLEKTSVIFSDTVKMAPLSTRMLNRVFSGAFRPLDGASPFIPEKWAPVNGDPMNPAARSSPSEFIETGFSAIDGLITLVRGQKLPLFSCAGLPAKEIVASILQNARIPADASKGQQGFAVVFIALGLTFHEYDFYMRAVQAMETDFVAFVNLADDPTAERLLAPRIGLTAAEYLAFDQGRDVLVIITDIANYCDALREISAAREELPGRRGYPGYMYSDLASLFERAGRLTDKAGTITLLPVVTMPEDDITHPIPDLTGYITEGQIVLSRDLHQQGVFPPIDVLPSLSRLMKQGIGERRTHREHRAVADQLYMNYARGRDLRGMEAVVGREGMSDRDRRTLAFAEAFEKEFIQQETKRRTIMQTLETGANLLQRFHLVRR